MSHCSIEPTNKREFGISVYAYLREQYGEKDHYSVPEIEKAVRSLDYPEAWECWALVAFMLPANAGEYFRSREIPMDVLSMKRAFIREMTEGERDTLRLSRQRIPDNDLTPAPLTQMNLVNLIAFYAGYRIGVGVMMEMLGE
jgi:hypothetical protein